jgi:MFS family permease
MPTNFQQTFSSLKIRNYRLYFIGQAISLCGTWMQTIGQAWLVLKMTNSGTQLGLVAAAQFLPILFFGPWGGVIADRFPKRLILYFTQGCSAALAVILAILVATGTAQLWMIYLLALGLGLINAIDNPTRQTFVMEMTGKNQLTNAISLNSVLFNIARVAGPAIGGVIIATVGLAPCFFINTLSFIAVIVALAMMRQSELFPTPIAPKVKGQLREGFKYVKSSKILTNVLLMMVIIGTLSYEFSVILPLFAQFTFHGNASTYAALTAAMGLGSILGGLYTANRKKIIPSMIVVSALIFGATIIVSALMPNLILAFIALMLVGFFSINFTSLANTTLQLESSPEMRGRVMSLWNVAFLGSTPIGGPIIGFIGEHASPRWGLAVGGIAAIIAAGLGYFSFKKSSGALIPDEQIINADLTAEQDIRVP